MATTTRKAAVKKTDAKKERKTPVRRSVEEKALAEFNRSKAAYERAEKRLDKALAEVDKANAAFEAASYEFGFWNAHPAIPDDLRVDLDLEEDEADEDLVTADVVYDDEDEDEPEEDDGK